MYDVHISVSSRTHKHNSYQRTKHIGYVPYLYCVRVRQSVSVAVRAEADKGDRQSQQTQEKCNPWRILGYIISEVGHRVPETHHPVYVEYTCRKLPTDVSHFSYEGFQSFCPQ